MRSTTFLLRLGVSAVCAADISNAAYSIEDTYDSSNFFKQFGFFTDPDPTDGFVQYVGAINANQTAIAGYSNGAVYLGVDHKTMNPSKGRESVRVSSNKAYTRGLIIGDIAHVPDSICGVWPAFWTVGPNWPSSGEIDIIEGVNDMTSNTVTLHSSAGCTMEATGSKSAKLASSNCNNEGGGAGCSLSTQDTQSFGSGFNTAGGGVYAADWTSTAVNVYFFPRASIPKDITAGNPDPSTWGQPFASFPGGNTCDINSHFQNHNIIFDTTFCGGWAGDAWANSTCSSLAPTCNEYVAQNPSAFANAYWLINSVKVYQDAGLSKRHSVNAVPFKA
jgi:hypothetical protein